jgi:beta-glucosidase
VSRIDINKIMPSATFHFPTGFLWGTSTSAYQVEGNNSNTNWNQWEAIPGKIFENQKSGKACDWWAGRWKEDMDRANATHQNAHRLSIEWSRIQPEINRWDEASLDHYREILQGLRDRDLSPIITLHHFTEPMWLSEIGGWENDEIISFFDHYVAKVVEGLKEYCNYWIPINEPNVLAHQAYIEANFPPGKRSLKSAFKALSNMVKAHICAYSTIHRIQPLSRVGTAINYRAFWPENHLNPLDQWMTKFLQKQYNDSYLNALRDGKFNFAFKKEKISRVSNNFDFLGLNYYSGDEVKFNLFKPKDLFHQRTFPKLSEISENGFIANIPSGLENAIHWATKYNRPIIITENGIEDSKDQLRPQYIIEHIHKIWRAANLSVPIKGYFHWTLADNFEWERGWSQRFGLWKLDVVDQTRIKTKSADLYSQICKTNSLSSEIINRFCPQIYSKIFPE